MKPIKEVAEKFGIALNIALSLYRGHGAKISAGQLSF